MNPLAARDWTLILEGTAVRVSWHGVPLEALTYSVIDIETTGLKPQGNGITELCCLRVAGGRVVDRLSTLVHPGRPIPPFITNLTGIDDRMVRGAPRFSEVIPSLLDFLGNSVLVAHNAPFDLSFLNYGLYCHGRPNLSNPVVDTLRLARRLLPGLTRGNLGAVTSYLGVVVADRHRAQGDAEATARVLLKLLEICLEQGIEMDDQLMGLLASRRTVHRPTTLSTRSEREKLAILAERCRCFPDSPGVYVMRSRTGRILYVGKAISLKKRLASYFNGGVPVKVRRLLREVETIEHRQTGSELEALLEESRLIKLHQPPFNTLLKSYEDFPFIKVEEDGPCPRLVVTRELHDDISRYFGPFRTTRGTELVLDILCRCFRIYPGPCPEPSRGANCVYVQMGRCLGPCQGPEGAGRHREAVEEVCRLLEQEPDELLAELTRRREAASDRMDFESAARYRDAAASLARAMDSRNILTPYVDGLTVLAVCPSTRPGWAELFVFGDGRLVDRARILPGEADVDRMAVEGLLETLAGRWVAPSPRPQSAQDPEGLDQVNIISAWMEKQGLAATTLALEPGWAGSRFPEVVDQVMEAARMAARGRQGQ